MILDTLLLTMQSLLQPMKQGIDVLNLVKTEEQMAGEKEEMEQKQQQATLLQQAGQFANSKLADTENMQAMVNPPQDQPQDQQPQKADPTGEHNPLPRAQPRGQELKRALMLFREEQRTTTHKMTNLIGDNIVRSINLV